MIVQIALAASLALADGVTTEDYNRAGVDINDALHAAEISYLDEAEDVNGNGIIETIQVSGSQYGPGIFIIEDQNGNGVLDPAEDVNGNERLDGGTQDHQVTATIQDNRLLLTSQTGENSAITLSDDDGVLFALGFFELDADGELIQNEVQLNTSGTNLVVSGNDAEITIDDETFTSASNVFSDIFEGITLEVRGGTGDPSFDTGHVRYQCPGGKAGEHAGDAGRRPGHYHQVRPGNGPISRRRHHGEGIQSVESADCRRRRVPTMNHPAGSFEAEGD